MFVVDTNVIAYLYLPTEYAKYSESLLTTEPEWAAPIVWRSELRNVLSLYVRQNILDLETALDIQARAEQLLQGNEFEAKSESVLNLTANSTCSAYDCEFVALAQALNTKLVTTDKKLLREFSVHCISLESFGADT